MRISAGCWVREGRTLEILGRLKKAADETLFMWDMFERVMSKVTKTFNCVVVLKREPSICR